MLLQGLAHSLGKVVKSAASIALDSFADIRDFFYLLLQSLIHIAFRDELLKELAVAAYNIAGNMVSHSASHKVTEHLTAILCW